jgi:hypothetical protein
MERIMLHASLTTLHVVSLILQRFADQPELRLRLLAGSGIGAADLDNADVRITRVQEQQVCANALALRADMGLELGRSLHVSSYGLLGYAALSADTLGDALRLLLRYPALLGTYFSSGTVGRRGAGLDKCQRLQRSRCAGSFQRGNVPGLHEAHLR